MKIHQKQGISAFISASYADEAEPTISWFKEVLQALAVELYYLKDIPEARKSEEKIKNYIEKSDVFILILVNIQKEPAGRPSNWCQNELGIAWNKNKPIAIFAENGVDTSGLGTNVTDIVNFDSKGLYKAVPRIIRYVSHLQTPKPSDLVAVCRNCGRNWTSSKPCGCWYTTRIMVLPSDDFVCYSCGADWSISGKTCGCGGWAPRIRKEEYPPTYGKESGW